MSTLKTANIQDTSGSNNSTPEQISQGRAKAWIVLDGRASIIGTGEDSFNVGGVTDHGTGDYTITFSTVMPSANYVIAGMVANTSNNFSSQVADFTRGSCGIHIKGTTAPTASAFRVETRFGSTSAFEGGQDDFSRVYIVVFGD